MSDLTLEQALSRGRAALSQLPDPLRDARTLLAHAAGLERDQLHRLDGDLPHDLVAGFTDLLARRAKGEPLARILGHRDFWTHRFAITDDVLDPRADTETLVARALDHPFRRVLDLGTGSGCILVSLLGERLRATGLGTDISQAALRVAAGNAVRLGVADRAMFQIGDWFDGIDGHFDLIVSNPPYIAASEMSGLGPEVRGHDPALALSDHGDGLSAYRAIAERVAAHLNPGGRVLLEIGWRQRGRVESMLTAAGLRDIVCHPDLEGRDRVISARLP